MSLASRSARAFLGLISTAINAALGATRRSISSRLAISRLVKKLTPVMVPPGRFRLATSPSSTGSLPSANTIGMAVPVALAALATLVPPTVTSTATFCRISSAAVRDPLECAVRPALFDAEVASFRKATSSSPCHKAAEKYSP